MKKYLAILFLMAFIVPSIAFASWWNPFSWFKKTTSTTQEVSPNQSTTGCTGILCNTINPPLIISQQVSPTPPTEQPKTKQVITPKKSTTSPKPTGSVNSLKASNAPSSGFFDTPIQPQPAPEIVSYREQVRSQLQEQIDALEKKRKLKEIFITIIQGNISDINDKITYSEGFKIGSPYATDIVDYTSRIFSIQVEELKARIEAENKMVEWLKNAYDNAKVELTQLQKYNTKEQLDAEIKNIQFYKDNLIKINKASSDWGDATYKTQTKIDGIIDGLSSLNSSSSGTNNLPSITITTPPPFIPSTLPSNKINCTSSPNIFGGMDTQCY